MKKILAMVLALVIVCGLAVAATAVGFDVSTDTDVIQAGETVTVTVALDEEIADVGQVQMELGYDEAVLTYDEANPYTLGEGYGDFLIMNIPEGYSVVQAYWLNFMPGMVPNVNLPAGTVFAIPFTANETTTVSELELTLKAEVNGKVINEDAVTITVCPGHEWYESDRTVSCTEDGEIIETCSVCGATKTTAAEATGHIEYMYPINEEWVTDPETNMPISKEVIYGCEYCGVEMRSETVYFLMTDFLPMTSIEVAPGETVVYQTMGLGGLDLVIEGSADYSVDLENQTWMETTVTEYSPIDGVVSFNVPQDMMYTVLVKITNESAEPATYNFDYKIPLGDWQNPQILDVGDNTVEIPADNYDGYCAQYVAQCTGSITFTVTGDYWSYSITNYGPDMENWDDDMSYPEQYFAYDDASNTMTIEVNAGDIVELVLASYYEAGMWDWVYPASTFNVSVIPNYTHEGYIVHVEPKDAGCYEDGNVEYWYCDCCGMVWTDEALTQESSIENVTIAAAHILEHVEGVEATCYEDGNVEHWHCTVCGADFADENANEAIEDVILPAGHVLVHIEAVAPGCHYEGNVEHWYCLVCGTVWTDEALTQISNHMNVILPELGGDVVHVEAKDPTCTENGNIEHWYCESCEQVWQDEVRTQLTNHKNVIVGAAGHVYGEDGVCTICGDNPKSGDTTISMAVAALIISAMSIVALPVVKKHF